MKIHATINSGGSSLDPTEISTLDGVTGNIQQQINGKVDESDVGVSICPLTEGKVPSSYLAINGGSAVLVTPIQIRRATSSEWTAANPILLSGEFGLDTTTGQVRVGNGSNNWAALSPLGTMTASQILTSLKTVDGANSGLDAEYLEGYKYYDFIRKNTSVTASTVNNETTAFAWTISGAVSVTLGLPNEGHDILSWGGGGNPARNNQLALSISGKLYSRHKQSSVWSTWEWVNETMDTAALIRYGYLQ